MLLSNLTVLERNIIHAFRGVCDDNDRLNEADEMFLRGVPKDIFKAEQAALDWLIVSPVVVSGLENAILILAHQQPHLTRDPWTVHKETC